MTDLQRHPEPPVRNPFRMATFRGRNPMPDAEPESATPSCIREPHSELHPHHLFRPPLYGRNHHPCSETTDILPNPTKLHGWSPKLFRPPNLILTKSVVQSQTTVTIASTILNAPAGHPSSHLHHPCCVTLQLRWSLRQLKEIK